MQHLKAQFPLSSHDTKNHWPTGDHRKERWTVSSRSHWTNEPMTSLQWDFCEVINVLIRCHYQLGFWWAAVRSEASLNVLYDEIVKLFFIFTVVLLHSSPQGIPSSFICWVSSCCFKYSIHYTWKKLWNWITSPHRIIVIGANGLKGFGACANSRGDLFRRLKTAIYYYLWGWSWRLSLNSSLVVFSRNPTFPGEKLSIYTL